MNSFKEIAIKNDTNCLKSTHIYFPLNKLKNLCQKLFNILNLKGNKTTQEYLNSRFLKSNVIKRSKLNH
ncbi:hypothetical protein BpHYR1_015169 [Brachionus plicatilis]|uniref:Uncharacterized protein n=1 Tax=Brachionus plicatilis TaxID=10195 RepID=A0A3M7RBY1_BRAPC|nr:hypothetical protein BpHYR1_015169 [Brachionus plicatilis]